MKRNVRKGKTMSKAENYIQDYTKRCSNATVGWKDGESEVLYQPWLTPENALAAVEIERQEVIEEIEKALTPQKCLTDIGIEVSAEALVKTALQTINELKGY